MKWTKTLTAFLVALAGTLSPLRAQPAQQQTIAADSCGLIVRVCQKYGVCHAETCTVVMESNGQYVVTKRDGLSGWYPASWHSVRVIEKLSAPAVPIDVSDVRPARQNVESVRLGDEQSK